MPISSRATAVEKGTPGFDRVVEAFGPDVVTPDGDLDRSALAARIFSDPVQKATLEAIVHPEVARRFGDQVDAYRATDRIVVYVTPLLVELGSRSGLRRGDRRHGDPRICASPGWRPIEVCRPTRCAAGWPRRRRTSNARRSRTS